MTDLTPTTAAEAVTTVPPTTTPRTLTRIAFLVTSLHGGGAEAVGIAWLNWFADAGYEVSAILVSDKPDSALVRPAVTVHREATTGSHQAKVRAVRELIRSNRYDALVALQTYPNLIAIAASKDRRADGPRPAVVVTEHNLISLGLPGSSLSHRVKIALAKRWYKRADAVTSPSHAVSAEMISAFGVAGDNAIVVPNPAMAKVTQRVPVRRRPGTDQGVQLILACRLVPQKRPHLALHTARALQDRGIDVEVVSFGGGPLEAELIALADQLGVRFVTNGWVEDWFTHFGTNSVVLLPSVREGFGNVLVEAAAVGVPSVAVSGALGVADAVIPGITGELALTDAPADLADAVERATLLTVENIDTWLSRFSIETSGGDLERVLEPGHVTEGQRMSANPTVSVVLPCYNVADFAESAIERLLTQQGVDLEIIAVDDASTDETAADPEETRRGGQSHPRGPARQERRGCGRARDRGRCRQRRHTSGSSTPMTSGPSMPPPPSSRPRSSMTPMWSARGRPSSRRAARTSPSVSFPQKRS